MRISKTKAVKAILKETFPDYSGRRFSLNDSGKVTFYDTNWGGGTRNCYTAIRLLDGKAEKLNDYAPWANPAEGATVQVPEGFAIVERSIFQGAEGGITIHIHPQSVEMLPLLA